MRIDLGPTGIDVASVDGRVALHGLRPAVLLGGDTGGADGGRWTPTIFETDGDSVVATDARQGLRLRLSATGVGDGAQLQVVLTNDGDQPVQLERLVVAATDQIRVGEDRRRWRTYRNGYQSWAGTATMGVDEGDRDVPTRFGRSGVTDARHRAPSAPGHVRSDWLSAICDPVSGDALAMSFTTTDIAFGFIELTEAGSTHPGLSIWADFDGVELAPGGSTPEIGVRLEAVTDDPSAGWAALRAVAEATGSAMAARAVDDPHPGGWCSWYYYFTKITEADVVENLRVLAEDGRDGPTFGCDYVMIDDGHQRAIGDWLDTDTAKLPGGMAALAGQIGDAGFDAGIWWAPFIVSSRSTVARDHPEWLVRTPRGLPLLGLVNPAWGIATPMRVLDTTHPGALDHIAATASTIADWGYRIQKLDFLFAAARLGVRHDRSATRAMALRRGLEAVRSGAGESSFLLGCGCPLGPAVGVVDAMRIGSDVTPY